MKERFVIPVVAIVVASCIGTAVVAVPAVAGSAAMTASDPLALDLPALLAVLVGLVVIARSA